MANDETLKKPTASAICAPDPSLDANEPAYDRRFQRIQRLVSLIAHKKIHALFVGGQPGVSKTTTVMNTLVNENQVEGRDFIVCKGHCSPLAAFMTLHKYGSSPDEAKIIIFDDADGVITGGGGGANIFKAVLDDKPKRVVSYLSTRLPEGVAPSFEFYGRVIFISNIKISETKDPDLQAIKSRCHHVEVFLSQAELFRFIEHRILPFDYENTSFKERKYVFDCFVRAAANSATRASIRTFKQLLDLYILDDRDAFDLHAEEILPASNELGFLRSMLKQNMTVEDAATAFHKVTGKSRRSFFLLKAKYRDLL